MIDVILDSAIYLKNPHLDDASFKALVKLCKNSQTQLHIPFIVEQEFISDILAGYEKHINSMDYALDSLFKEQLPTTVRGILATTNHSMAEVSVKVSQWLRDGFDKWAVNIKADRMPLATDHAGRVLNSYFLGLVPFESKKSHKDISGSFFYEAVKDVAATSEVLYLVVGDEALNESCRELNKAKVLKSLEELIELDEFQSLLKGQLRIGNQNMSEMFICE